MYLWIDIHVLSVMSAITISPTEDTVRSPALLPRRRPWTGWRMCTTEGWRITCPWSSSVAPFTAVWTTLCTLSAHLPTFYNNFTPTSREFREFLVCSNFYSDLQYIWIHAQKPKFIVYFGFLHNFTKHKINILMYVHDCI